MPKAPKNPTDPSRRKPWIINSEQWRDRLSHIDALPQLTLLGLLTGVIAGVVILLFRLTVELPLRQFLPVHTENFEALSPLIQFLLPFGGALVLGLVLQGVDSRHHGTGVSHVLDRLHNHQGRLPIGNFLTQLGGGAWCLITGQSVGREGPAVHLGASSGSLLGQWLRLPNNCLRPLAGCGVAAAIAACFNTPMAGVIFAMEVVVMEYSIAGFIPVILAAVAGTVINQLVFGSGTVFHPPQSQLGSLTELPLMAATGFAVAGCAAAYIRLQAYSCRWSLNKPIALRFGVVGVIAGIGSLVAPQIMGVGYDTIDAALANQLGFWLLVSLLLIKLLVTSTILGAGIPGGVIGPLLFMGACLGGAVGVIAHQILPNNSSDTGFYVILGMGAMMGATLNAPLAAMMAILELTYNPHIIFPSMLVVISACLATRWVFRCEGLFQTLLKVQGKKSSLVAIEQLLSKTGARNLLDKHIKVSNAQVTVAEAKRLIDHHPHWIVIDASKRLLNPTDLAMFLVNLESTPDKLLDLETIPARRLDTIELDEQTNLYQALVNMNHTQVDAAYIRCEQKPGIGIITREKIDNYYKI